MSQCLYQELFFNIDRIMHQEFIPQRQIVNQHISRDFLQHVQENVQCEHPEKWHIACWYFHKDSSAALIFLCRNFWPQTT